jgi:hypothetical protein
MTEAINRKLGKIPTSFIFCNDRMVELNRDVRSGSEENR